MATGEVNPPATNSSWTLGGVRSFGLHAHKLIGKMTNSKVMLLKAFIIPYRLDSKVIPSFAVTVL